MKKDQKRNKTEKALSYFPKINRFITERWKLILSSFISVAIIFGIIFQGIALNRNMQTWNGIMQERSRAGEQLRHWQVELSKYPDHRDIYFKIATLEYELGNIELAKVNLDRSMRIDPNFEQGIRFEKQLSE